MENNMQLGLIVPMIAFLKEQEARLVSEGFVPSIDALIKDLEAAKGRIEAHTKHE